MPDPLVHLDGVTVVDPRSGRTLLGPLDLRIDAGERVLVLGPSGSGKSTLLAVLSGVIPHSVNLDLTGSVRVCGRSTADVPVHELARDVGTVPQDPTSGMCLPIVETEVALTLENHAVAPADIDVRIEEALSGVGAAHLRQRRTRQLSGGEQQRIATAAALAARPRLVLVDEPTSMLDAAGVTAVLAAVDRLRDRRGATVMVDHRLDEVARHDMLPQRTVVLADGQVLADGPTGDVLQRFGPRLAAMGAWLPSNDELALDQRTPTPRRPEPAAGGSLSSVRELSVRRGDRSVLSGVDLTVSWGEVVAVVGPNGAGKSTLLQAMTGLVTRQQGSVRCDGRVGLVVQNPEHQFLATTLAAELTAGEVPVSADRARDLLAELRLAHLEEANPFRLSGGEKRRLSVAAALAREPDLMLADEPTYGLDRHDTHRVMAALAQLADRGGATVFASHDLRQVAVWADRVLVVVDGRLVLDGPTAEVLADPRLEHAGVALPPLVHWALERPGGLLNLRELEPQPTAPTGHVAERESQCRG